MMVNTEDEEEPQGSQFIVDGEYVPRVLFMSKYQKNIFPLGNLHIYVAALNAPMDRMDHCSIYHHDLYNRLSSHS